MNEKEQKLFFKKVKVPENPEDCWEWTGALGGSGLYARFSIERVQVSAARCSYRTFVGPIEYEIDHKCENHACVNPEHLQDITKAKNLRLKFDRKTHCKWGHERTPENTYVDPRGWRECLECRRITARHYVKGGDN